MGVQNHMRLIQELYVVVRKETQKKDTGGGRGFVVWSTHRKLSEVGQAEFEIDLLKQRVSKATERHFFQNTRLNPAGFRFILMVNL